MELTDMFYSYFCFVFIFDFRVGEVLLCEDTIDSGLQISFDEI